MFFKRTFQIYTPPKNKTPLNETLQNNPLADYQQKSKTRPPKDNTPLRDFGGKPKRWTPENCENAPKIGNFRAFFYLARFACVKMFEDSI